MTLLTGDKVTIAPATSSGPGVITVEGPEGEPAGARVVTVGGDTYVYPDSAQPYLAGNVLDRRLFNVTQLVADGYDKLEDLPLIITCDGAQAAAAALRRRADAMPGAAGVRQLPSINGVALAADRDHVADLWSFLTGTQGDTPARIGASSRAPQLKGDVTKVWLDGKAKATLSDSVAQIGAPGVWSRGNSGEGVDVAVLDSGFDPDHPDLRAAVEDSQSFVPGEEVTDRLGHGTHVASIIAGNGAASGGLEKGVAPGVDLHVGKVLGDDGVGYDSWILAGMEWAARDVHARVISMSLGSGPNSDGETVLARAVDALSEETGALFTIAAGNDGPTAQTVGSPGTASAALTVGAVDSEDAIASFSSRGPGYGDDALKPEITAPGVDILAARSQHSAEGSGYYRSLSGTSMATPHVAGVAALVAAAHPDWTGSRIKDALISTVKATPEISADDGGNGRVDAAAATATLTATGKIDAGIHSPGEDQGTNVSTATWTNTANEAVTIDLAVEAPGVPAYVFSISQKRLSVPAHGTASTAVTTDPGKAGELQRWTGHLTASTDGTVRTRTLLGVSTRQRLLHVRTKITGRSGEPTSGFISFFRKGDEQDYSHLYGDGNSDDLLLPGRYTVVADFPVEGTHGASSAGFARLVIPQVDITDDIDLVLDGTKLREVAVATPRNTQNVTRRLDYHRMFADGSSVTNTEIIGDAFDSIWTAPTAPGRDGDQYLTARWRNQEPQLSVAAGGQEFDDLWVMPGSKMLTEGEYGLDLIHPGQGLAGDYEGVAAAGKAAIVRWVDGDTSDDQVRAAQAAGVKLLLFVNSLDGRLKESIVKTSLEAVGVSRTEGEKLISRVDASVSGSVRLHAVSHPDTDYLYDLVRTFKGRIPADLTYAPKQSQLARIEVSFRNPNGRDLSEYRYDQHPWARYNVGSTLPSTSSAHRTDYVTADNTFSWSEEATLQAVATSYSGPVRYPVGHTTDVTWFGTVFRPRFNDHASVSPTRTGNVIELAVPAWGDSGGNHAAYDSFGSGTVKETAELYRGGTLLASGWGYVQAEVSSSKGTYRLVHTGSREATADFPYSTSTRTEWTFTSGAPRNAQKPEQLPLVQLDYNLPTSTDGKAAHNATLLVTPVHLAGAPHAALQTRKVELSYDDGATWSTARLTGCGNGKVSTVLKAPKAAQYVTIRVQAGDTRGNTITQTVARAAGIAR
ncbi:S8 family serine peptidase [Streptomyces sp. PA03-6a]|nr:S8 family serine peptidase [Streptomyces sp. PA03-6a]